MPRRTEGLTRRREQVAGLLNNKKRTSVTPVLPPSPAQDKTHPDTKNREDRPKPRRRRPDRLPGRQIRGDLHDVGLLTGSNGNLPDDPVATVVQHDVLDAAPGGCPERACASASALPTVRFSSETHVVETISPPERRTMYSVNTPVSLMK